MNGLEGLKMHSHEIRRVSCLDILCNYTEYLNRFYNFKLLIEISLENLYILGISV